MGNDRPVEVEPVVTPLEMRPLVDMTDPSVMRTNGTQVADRRLSDPYGYSGSPEDNPNPNPSGTDRPDPYGYHGSPENIQLSAEAEKKIKDDLAAYQKSLAEGNFSFGFQRGEGPWNAIDRLRTAALAKQKSGAELTAEEKAVLSMPVSDMVKESRRIRDRDFAAFKEKGDPRDFYKTSDKTVRWTDKEITQMMQDKEKQLRAAAEKAARDEIARQQEAERKRIEEEQAAQREAERQRQLAEAIERHVPNEQTIKAALIQSEQRGDAAQMAPIIRANLKAHITQEIQAGTLKPEDLQRPVRVGSALVATGAITAQELTAALVEQDRLRQAAGPQGQVPRLGEILENTFKNDQAKVAKIKKASAFYDALKRLTEESSRPPRR